MPELPEVEICARNLRRWLLGRTIDRVRAQEGLPLRDITPQRLSRGLKGRKVLAIDRHGKQLILRLSDQTALLAHLGMTGKFVRAEDAHVDRRPGERVRFEIDDGSAVLFVDQRRFGRLRHLPHDAALAHPEVARLGPDALQVCAQPGELARAMAGTRTAIKVALMDQRRVAGIGNIYASDGLFVARVNPFAPADRISAKKMNALGRAIITVMNRSLDEDTDEVLYVNESGSENRFEVYGKAGEPCPRCGRNIDKATQAQRSTFYCKRCQARPAG